MIKVINSQEKNMNLTLCEELGISINSEAWPGA